MIRLSGIFCLLSLLTLNFHSVATATEDPVLRNILQKHWEAMGGMNNWNKVESIRLNGTIKRDGQIVDICIVRKRPNQIRATITLPIPGSEDEKLQVIRAHDGKTAWTATRIAGAPKMVKEELPAEAAAELLADAGVLPPLIKLWQEGVELRLAKSISLRGKKAITIKTAANIIDGNQKAFYICPENFTILKQESIEQNGAKTVTELGEYESQFGILIPTHRIIDSDETGRSVISINTIKVGVGIYEDYFNSEGSYRKVTDITPPDLPEQQQARYRRESSD